jgi:hypothetical protein
MLEELPDDGSESAALRWAIVVCEDAGLNLQLQSLRGTAAHLNGRPLAKRLEIFLLLGFTLKSVAVNHELFFLLNGKKIVFLSPALTGKTK